MLLVPLLAGIAIVTDFRGISRIFMQPSRRSPSAKGMAGPHLLAGWFFIVLSALGLLLGFIGLVAG
ncbi:hypothetical protein [Kitasatospora sp. NPDC091207]|uniref:hypothetical protein n=1 Tax=Kitasatospora sp. NPDC091207 TaxID=3364083 RepID=UPI0037F40FFE